MKIQIINHLNVFAKKFFLDMTYSILLLFSVYSFGFLYTRSGKLFDHFVYAAIFCMLLWTIVLGGQYNVGTDYFTYLYYFNNPSSLSFFSDKGEWGFYYLIIFCRSFGITGQGIFAVIILLESFLFFVICAKYDKKNPEIFILLYIVLSSLFHNQMNAVRQSIAVYFVTLSVLCLIDKQWIKCFLFTLIAAIFHNSVYLFVFLLPFFFLIRKRHSSSLYMAILIIGSLFAFLSVEDLIKELIAFFPEYSHYAESDYLSEISLLGKITKVGMLPFYAYSLVVLKADYLSVREYRLFAVGIISYSLKNMCLVSSVTNRVGFYFMLLSVFPIYYLIRYLQETRQMKKVYLVYFIFVFLYCVKIVLFPRGEYSYNSIYKFYL